MKRILTLCFFSFLVFSSLSAQNRLVFIEEFTQASCPPCEASSPQLNAIMSENADKVVEIRYHTSFPGVDPMNADNPSDVLTRRSFYGITGVPGLRIDGGSSGATFPALVTQAEIDSRYASNSDVSMELTHEFNDDNSAVMITLSVTNDGSSAYSVASNRLRIALVEEVIDWPFRPGSTSLTEFHSVMKDFVTDVSGMMLPEIAAGDTWTESWMVDVPSTTYSMFELAAVAWIQNDQSRQVVNATESHPATLNGDYTDLQAVNNTNAESFCGESIEPTVTLVNNGSVDITDASVILFVNGQELTVETVAETIPAFSSTEYTFAQLDRPAGVGDFDFQITSVNGSADDLVAFNNYAKSSLIPTLGSYTSLDENFENLTFRETGDFIKVGSFADAFVAVTPAQFGTTANVGFFSRNSMLINYYGWATVGDEASILFGEVDMTTTDNPKFSFTYTGASFQASQDELYVEVSTDCGDTWSNLWTAIGADLATQGAVNTGIYFPTFNSTWVPVELDLSAYTGMSNVTLRFRAVSAYGNAVYLDDISLEGIISDNNEIVDASLASIYPNPVNATAMIDLDLTEASDVVLQVTDINGKILDTKSYGLLSGANTLRYDVDALSSGLYIFNVVAGDVVSPQRVSVIK